MLALCECPALLEEPRVTELFPPDAVERARTYLAGIPGGLGAYSESAGVPSLRASIAAALVRRDGGVAADPDDILLIDGALWAPPLSRPLLAAPRCRPLPPTVRAAASLTPPIALLSLCPTL